MKVNLSDDIIVPRQQSSATLHPLLRREPRPLVCANGRRVFWVKSSDFNCSH